MLKYDTCNTFKIILSLLVGLRSVLRVAVRTRLGAVASRLRLRARPHPHPRPRPRPRVVQPVFRSNAELSMRFIEPAVEPAGRLRRRSTRAPSGYLRNTPTVTCSTTELRTLKTTKNRKTCTLISRQWLNNKFQNSGISFLYLY